MRIRGVKQIGGIKLAPQVGLEPTTKRLTAARSTAELLRNAESLIKFLDKTYGLVAQRLILPIQEGPALPLSYCGMPRQC
jgi:hypothetical protein